VTGGVYRIEHQTRYFYGSRVTTSQHVACLRPRDLTHQHVRWHELAIIPTPAHITRRVDYFGNLVDQFEILLPHAELRATSCSIVEVTDADPAVEPAMSTPWEATRDALAYKRGAHYHECVQFAYASAYVTVGPELAAFGQDAFAPGRPLLEAAVDLMHCIHTEFKYDPTATTLTTPVTRVLAERRGVCQDFAHLQISCLRSLGVAARYVSGYMLTDPPPGQPRLTGADASHSWLSVYCPVFGWVDLDPTNDLIVGSRHITVAWGRDYGEVSPLRGVILGGGDHALEVGVSVVPLEE
jgi:transglutaminase-like putative cysteine protease